MSEALSPNSPAPSTPKIGFVSLGCPKALTDSELILTQLSAEGYQTSKTFQGADLVIVNTCGFIDDAVKESLDTIGEALAENGKVIVTGCLGAKSGRGRRQSGEGNASQRAGRDRPACHAGGDGRGACALPQAARSVHRSGAGRFRRGGPQADAAPLRLPEDQRGLQPSLHLLHHPFHARRPGQPAGGRRAEGGQGPVRGRREGVAGDQPGHLGLRRGCEVPHRLLGRQAGQDPPAGTGAGAGRTGRGARCLGALALRLSVPACGRDPAADGCGHACCLIWTCRSSTATPRCCGA